MFATVDKRKFTLPVDYDNLKHSEKWAVREEYRRIQKDACWYCNKSLYANPSKKVQKQHIFKKLFPKGFFDHPIHLHHSHDTGLTIGAVHAKCNAYLWQVEGK